MSRRIAGEPGSSKSCSARTTSEASLRFDGRTPQNSVSWSVISKALAAIPCALLPFFISSQVNVYKRAKRLQSHVGAGQPKGCSLGRTGVGNEQRSIQGLSKSSLGQARLRIQSRDQSCKCALVQDLKALSTGSEIQTPSCSSSSSTSVTSVASLGNRS